VADKKRRDGAEAAPASPASHSCTALEYVGVSTTNVAAAVRHSSSVAHTTKRSIATLAQCPKVTTTRGRPPRTPMLQRAPLYPLPPAELEQDVDAAAAETRLKEFVMHASTAELDAAAFVVHAMQKHLSSVGVQRAGCAAIASLAAVPSVRYELVKQRAFDRLVAAWQRHAVPSLHEHVALALSRLGCHHDGLRLVNIFTESSAIPDAFALLERNLRSSFIAQRLLEFLGNMASGHQDLVVRIARVNKGVHHVYAALDAHPDDAKVQSAGYRLLYYMTNHNRCSSIIAVMGGAGKAIDAMRRHGGR
jgi:hypothetical protein